jgi:hypothetical protein
MSDLRSEIVSKVLNQWDNVPTQVKQSFGEKVFSYIKDHPYCTITEIKEALDVGDTQSAASTLKTLVDRGLIDREEKPMRNYPGFGRRTQYVYFAVADSYQTVNKGYWKPKGIKRGRPLGSKNTVKPVRIAESPELADVLEKKLAKSDIIKDLQITKKPFVAEDFIEGLSVTQAKAVYLALKAIFDSRLHG